ncbi:MAG TPA: D-alanyl-D-alanine carboxypeptidase [Spirochaetota bacterium]|nr:D-alanyl-D-alanine carboxypeptidase [Spirochaetota bacterium]
MKKILNIFIYLVTTALALSVLCCGGDPDSPGTPVNSGPPVNGFNSSDYGYAVYDVEHHRLVMDHNIYSPFIPASVTKLVTAIFAFQTLGPDFTFSTDIFYTGKISKGVITGDIYIKGSGDPELSVSGLALLAHKLKDEGVTAVQGNFYYDESAVKTQEMLDPNMADYAPYNSGIGALNLNKNTIQVVRRKGGNDNSFYYDFLPSVSSITSEINEGTPVFPFVSYSYRNRKETWLLPSKNIIAPRYQLPVKHTGSYTASVFSGLCSIHGIKLKDPLPGTIPGNSKNLCSHTGRTLSEIIPDMLISSDNLTAEVLGRTACKQYSNDAGHNINFPEAADLFFREEFTSVTQGGFILANASGLSTRNRLTPEQAVAVLITLSRDYNLEDMLPMSGESGTLKSRLDTPETAYRVYAKTGSISYSSALAGLFYGASGKKYMFALFIDSKDSRAILDSKKSREKSDSDAAGKWSKKASDAADDFISTIIRTL